jgi:4'-phosphopantetheinyl transferase
VTVQQSPLLELPVGIVDLWLQNGDMAGSADFRFLNSDERGRARRIVDDNARTLFILGRSLVRAVLSTYVNRAPETLRFDQRCARCRKQHGKPRLVAPASDLEFSLSHARGLIALAVCRGSAVGIDVEWRGWTDAMPQVAPLLLAEAEWMALQYAPDGERPKMLLEYWVRKEALLKATAEGLRADPRNVSILWTSDRSLVCRRNGTWWSISKVDVSPDHVGALALKERVPQVRRHQVTKAWTDSPG